MKHVAWLLSFTPLLFVVVVLIAMLLLSCCGVEREDPIVPHGECGCVNRGRLVAQGGTLLQCLATDAGCTWEP